MTTSDAEYSSMIRRLIPGDIICATMWGYKKNVSDPGLNPVPSTTPAGGPSYHTVTTVVRNITVRHCGFTEDQYIPGSSIPEGAEIRLTTTHPTVKSVYPASDHTRLLVPASEARHLTASQLSVLYDVDAPIDWVPAVSRRWAMGIVNVSSR